MRIASGDGAGFLAAPLMRLFCFIAIFALGAGAACAQYSASGLYGMRGSTGLYGQPGLSIPYPFHYNELYTTYFGPASADIQVESENFLACRPPLGPTYSYALCYYSGPAVSTPAAAPGATPVNPALPCTLSADGKSANCTCYGLTTDQYPPPVPYFIDINAILNLDLYLSTISVCGHDGANCSPHDTTHWNKAPACQAANSSMVIPTAQLISVFTPAMGSNYTSGSTSCSRGKYAGCMTAPCYHTGKFDSAGNELVQCKCPVFEGPFEIGQPNMPCDANALTPTPQSGSGAARPSYVWSAAHNPKLNPADPPATGCLPDMAGDKGCPLYKPGATYPVAKGSPLCQQVCNSYRKDIRANASTAGKGVQIPYSCDAAICTTLGIGQTPPLPPPNPLKKASLLQNACGGLSSQPGLQAIMTLEEMDQCSCCASQVCGCANPGTDINADTQAEIGKLNAGQQQIGIEPQCQINGTLCGAQAP
jgi:hypothetical protein